MFLNVSVLCGGEGSVIGCVGVVILGILCVSLDSCLVVFVLCNRLL